MLGKPGGSRGVDVAFLRLFAPGVGAEIIGAGKFGYPGCRPPSRSTGACGGWGRRPACGTAGSGPAGPYSGSSCQAGLVDHMHIVVVPILLGRGVRLWDGLEGIENDYEIEATSSPSGATHMTFTRPGV